MTDLKAIIKGEDKTELRTTLVYFKVSIIFLRGSVIELPVNKF